MNAHAWTVSGKTILVLGALFHLLAPAGAQELGTVNFPASGSPEAQPHFEAGLLLLHNFEYEDAAARFRRAREIDPDFAMAYWGEAQTFNHPIWMEQDREAALAVLAAFAPTPRERLARVPTPRERDWLETVEVLYGEGPKEERDFRYRDAMRRLAEKYPEDEDARAFYALSLLGTAHGGRDFTIYMKAAAVAQPVLEENPMHPGAAHYVIHAFDDPIHAPLGLPAARAYSGIAPDAGHAQHMTSHIFVAMAPDEAAYFVQMKARAVIDPGDWARAGEISADLTAFPGLALPNDFTDALAALRTGDVEHARQLRARYGEPGDEGNPRHAILLMELDALLSLTAGDSETGIALLGDAARQEETLPYEFGPPATPMPPHELLAVELAALGREREALPAWRDQLARTPRRTQSLLGLARTATALGDEAAAREAYTALAQAWSAADEEVPGLVEARAGGSR